MEKLGHFLRRRATLLILLACLIWAVVWLYVANERSSYLQFSLRVTGPFLPPAETPEEFLRRVDYETPLFIGLMAPATACVLLIASLLRRFLLSVKRAPGSS